MPEQYLTARSSELLQKLGKSLPFIEQVHYFASLGSSNTFIKGLAKNGAPHGTLVICDEQTEGRGRAGNVWKSSPGENLLFSLLLKPTTTPEPLTFLPLLTSLALAEALTDIITEKNPNKEYPALKIKWPNDVLLKGKKISGILLESTFLGSKLENLIFGIGVNVNQLFFPPELSGTATSLLSEYDKEFDRDELLLKILKRFFARYDEFLIGNVPMLLWAWKVYDVLIGKRVSFFQSAEEKIQYGEVLDVDEKGLLMILIDRKRAYFDHSELRQLRVISSI